jgi:hypothetical protein
MADIDDDPVVRRLLRYKTGLVAGGLAPGYDVLATYVSVTGVPIFAFCRHGLLLNPGPDERYVPFVDVDDAGYYNREMIERAIAARAGGHSAPLTIRLTSGEAITLPLERRDEKIPDLLTIAKLIHQRSVIDRAERGERWVSGTWRRVDAASPNGRVE